MRMPGGAAAEMLLTLPCHGIGSAVLLQLACHASAQVGGSHHQPTACMPLCPSASQPALLKRLGQAEEVTRLLGPYLMALLPAVWVDAFYR